MKFGPAGNLIFVLEDIPGENLKSAPRGNPILVMKDGPGGSLTFGSDGNPVGPGGWNWRKFKIWTWRKSYFGLGG